jgi:hypothetical protein
MKNKVVPLMTEIKEDIDLCCNFVCPHNNKANIEVMMQCMPGVCDKFPKPSDCNCYMDNIPPKLYFPLNKIRGLIKKFQPGQTSPEEAFSILSKIKFELEENKQMHEFNTINGTVGCYPILLFGFFSLWYFLR